MNNIMNEIHCMYGKSVSCERTQNSVRYGYNKKVIKQYF